MLLHNLFLFGRVLRGLGLDVNTGRMLDLVAALDHLTLSKQDVRNAARALLVHDKEDIPLFDEAFEMFWQKPVDEWRTLDLPSMKTIRRKKPLVVPPPVGAQTPSDPDAPEPPADRPPLLEVTQTYSARELLRRKDFADMNEEEIVQVKRVMAEFVWQLGERRTRRRVAGDALALDFRRTLRASLRHGGEVMALERREIKYKPRPLVILADISGSMERYTRLLLNFVYSISNGLDQPVESFVFGTRLTRITRELREKQVDVALKNCGRAVHDWGAGTRIGESLKQFNFGWAKRVLGHGAVVLVISDGWDRGEPELLAREMRRLHLNCHRLIWLNPLLGAPEYEPLTRGIQAALPHIDDFLPVHNLASLEDLAGRLSKVGDR